MILQPMPLSLAMSIPAEKGHAFWQLQGLLLRHGVIAYLVYNWLCI